MNEAQTLAALFPAAGTRITCTKCKVPQDPDQFRAEPKRKSGRSPHCKTCQSNYSKAWYYRNWEKRRAELDAYKAAHPEKEQAYRKRKWDRIASDPKQLKQVVASNRAWCKANPERRREHERNRTNKEERAAFKRTWDKQRIAIGNGTTSPTCKIHGFALVRDDEGNWRAARSDRPWNANERAYALFRWGCGGMERWFVFSPSLSVPDPNLVRRLQARAQKGQL